MIGYNWTLRPEGHTVTQRGPLYRDGYQPQLSGHETFPLRYGWLKKAYDAVAKTQEEGDNRSVFTGPEAIVNFGVGKNMVASMRYWALAAGVIEEHAPEKKIATTSLGDRLFGSNGYDPYMEEPATSWIIHWNICSDERKATWFWAFHHAPYILFDREDLVRSILRLSGERQWARASAVTIRRDVSCFLRTYVSESPTKQSGYEDGLESPLSELGLVRSTGTRDRFRFVLGAKATLGVGVFAYAVSKFWDKHHSNSNTLSYEALAFAPGSPGRAFMLDENELVAKLSELEEETAGTYRWSETAGLKQLLRVRDIDDEETVGLAAMDYGRPASELKKRGAKRRTP